MAPTSYIYDIWSMETDSPNIVVDCLMPNGLIIPLHVQRDSTLLDIKQDLWDEAQREYPMFGVLRDMHSYIFMCINQTADKEEIIDETRRLRDVKPFQPVLKVVERKGDKAEKLLNAQIGLLIGKGLHEFDALQNPEVNEFRFKMRTMCEDIAKEWSEKSWLERALYQYPLQLEASPELNESLKGLLIDNKLVIRVKFEKNEISLSFRVQADILPKDLIHLVLMKRAVTTGQEDSDVDKFVFKVVGKEEFIFGDSPLCQFKYIREAIAKSVKPELVLMEKANMCVDTYIKPRPKGPRQNDLPPRKPNKSSYEIKCKYLVTINSLIKVNCQEGNKVAIRAGLFHGGESLCSVINTHEATVDPDGELFRDVQLLFDIDVCNIPRMARLCFVVYSIEKIKGNKTKGKKGSKVDLNINSLAWANITVFDYKSHLCMGATTLHMWPYTEDILHSDDILHPLGTVVSNPNKEEATSLTITFSRFANEPIIYPVFEEMLSQTDNSTNEDSQGTVKLNTVPHMYLEQIRQICDKDALNPMHEQEKELLWFLRQYCRYHLPHSLSKLLRCIKWNDKKDVTDMQALLKIWPTLPLEQALELLDYAYADPAVRKFAVTCLKDISDDDLLLYLLQLVQALKHESFLQCDLVEFLLHRALSNYRIGHYFFWLLRSEMHVPSVSVRFGLILEAYCCGAQSHMKSLMKQVEAQNKLRAMTEIIKSEGNKKIESLNKQLREILQQNSYREVLLDLHSSLNPAYRMKWLKIDSCKVMNSKMKPLWLCFENSDSHGQDIYLMFKNGDDLRQDMLTLQILKIMDKLWKDNGLDLRMNIYDCISSGYEVGMIQLVLNAETIANIQKKKGTITSTLTINKGSLLDWLKEHNPEEKSSGLLFTRSRLNEAVEEFTLSCAGYCVATYVLGIGDRHNDNIMIKKSGQLFHIDYGHFLGNFKSKFGMRRERVPFVLTHDFVHVITKGSKGQEKSQEFIRFQNYCEQAFMILRRKGSLFITLFAMMLSTGIPELTCEKDLDYLRETLALDRSEAEALKHFRSKFEEALRNSWKTNFNWAAHNLVKDNKND